MRFLGFRAASAVTVGATLFIVMAACGGSDGTSSSTPFADAGPEGAAAGCTPGATECVNATLARVCPADGSGWLASPCGAGEVCAGGVCTHDLNAACSPGSGKCTDATTGLACRPDGKGYQQVTCPDGTTCTGNGICAGACIVGESYCISPGVLATCADGKTLAQTACANGQLCVGTSGTTAAVRTAACKPAACTPDRDGCDFVCGNRLDAAADQTKFMSYCGATPNGYTWEVVACATSQSCDPSGGSCNGGRDRMAACKSACTPGQQRCSADGLSIQSCDASGQWSATVTPCTASASSALQLCMPKPGTPGAVVCGDPLCARGYAGTCDATGAIKLCDATGKIAAAATPCAAGVCRDVGRPISGVAPGACVTDCVAGESRCTAPGANSYQTCSSGVWSATTTTCAGGASCFGYTNPTGLRNTVCGVCAPGTHECQGDQIRTCDATGQLGAATACTVGRCRAINGTDAACVADCVPGSKVCAGGTKNVPGLPYARGTDSEGTCTANGLLPASPTACGATAACRVASTGVAVGCVECVGPGVAGGNEYGFTDSRCTDATGVFPGSPPNSATQVCGNTNTWPATAAACGGGQTCSIGRPGFSCRGACPDPFDFGGTCTASGLASAFPGTNVTCATFGQTTMSCGTTPDCCSNECSPTGAPVPSPAYCQ